MKKNTTCVPLGSVWFRCNAMTVMTFGVLALCRTPLLRQIGATVAIGALAALVLAFMFAGPRPRAMVNFA